MTNRIASPWSYFQWSEIVCPCCKRVKITKRLAHHMELLDQLRDWWGSPITVTSGYRCPAHNKAVGGAVPKPGVKGSGSQHLKFATDVSAQGITNAVHPIADKAERLGFTGIGRYSTFVHLDLRKKPAQWSGS